MNFARATNEEILFQAGLRINNSLNDSKVLNAVSLMGYTEAKLQEGAVLLQDATSLYETQKKEYGEVDEAQQQFEDARKAAHKNYMNLLSIARIAFKNNVQASATLDLNGKRASTISGWLKQTLGFYRAIMANEEWKTALAAYGQTEDKLTTELAAVNGVMEAAEAVKKEKGDAQNATQERDEKIEELVDWVTDYEVIARIALTDKPQLLEKLGIVVKA
uniref:hypothetical protein n=1 Tax=uncultured Draconibacterium sp. TaxID=1573823 RepID=UPI00321636BE